MTHFVSFAFQQGSHRRSRGRFAADKQNTRNGG